MDGVLLITCSPGNEEMCEYEVGNVIYPYDPGVVIEKTMFKGLLIVKTKIDSIRAFNILTSREYGFVEKIIPFQKIIHGTKVDKIVEAALELVEKENISDYICLQVRVRGIRGLSSTIWVSLANKLREKGIRISNKAEKCIFVESINDLFGVSLLPKNKVHV